MISWYTSDKFVKYYNLINRNIMIHLNTAYFIFMTNSAQCYSTTAFIHWVSLSISIDTTINKCDTFLVVL